MILLRFPRFAFQNNQPFSCSSMNKLMVSNMLVAIPWARRTGTAFPTILNFADKGISVGNEKYAGAD